MSFININFNQKKAPKGAFCIVVEILCKSVVDCSSQNDNKKCHTEYEFVILNAKESIFTAVCHTERSEVSQRFFASPSLIVRLRMTTKRGFFGCPSLFVHLRMTIAIVILNIVILSGAKYLVVVFIP